MAAPLRIALLGYGYSHHIQRLAQGLANRGHKIYVITASKHGPYPTIPGVTFETFDSSLSYLSRIRQVRKILETIRPDVLHSHFVNYGGFIGLATNFHPHLLSAWGCDILNVPKDSKLMNIMTHLTVKSADGLLPVSKELQSELVAYSNSTKLNQVVNWGVDTQHFRPENRTVDFRKSWGLNSETVVLSPRMLEPHYNQHLLLEAWPEFKAQCHNAKLIIIKMRPELQYQNALEKMAKDLGISNDIIWIDEVAYESLPSLYNSVDILVSIPTTDGTPMTVLEAMACGTAIAATNTPSLREWILPTCLGDLLKSLDANSVTQSLATLTVRISADTSLARAASRALVIDRVSREKSLSELENIYLNYKGTMAKGWKKTLNNIMRAK